MFEVRTDLAVEENERITKAQEETKGISVTDEDYGEEQIHITTVRITTENGAIQMGKPKGTYITLEAAEMIEDDEDYHREISKRLAEILKELIPVCNKQKNYKESTENKKKVSRKGFAQAKHELEGTSILVAGLGNRLVTPDALGPQVADNLYITRHIIKEFGRRAYENEQVQPVSAIVPGVMAQTGMETAQIMRGIVRETKPDLVIAIDALAARSIRRLGTTIQVTDTGIHPGSGVGNHRHGLTRESLGVPVIAIGVPTVVGTAAIVYDTVSVLIQTLLEHAQTREIGGFLDQLDSDEQYRLICELLEPEFGQMYVTPPDIDQTIKAISYTISEAIQIAFLGGE